MNEPVAGNYYPVNALISLDDGTHDAAGIQVLSAAEVAPLGYYTRDGLGLKGVQLFA